MYKRMFMLSIFTVMLIFCWFTVFQINMAHLILFRPILHLKPARTGPSPRASLITSYTLSERLLPLLCPLQHQHSTEPKTEAHLTCETHLSMLIIYFILPWVLLLFFFIFILFSRNEWGPPDRKVDTRKYRAEPRSIFDYEPGKSSVLEQEREVSDL